MQTSKRGCSHACVSFFRLKNLSQVSTGKGSAGRRPHEVYPGLCATTIPVWYRILHEELAHTWEALVSEVKPLPAFDSLGTPCTPKRPSGTFPQSTSAEERRPGPGGEPDQETSPVQRGDGCEGCLGWPTGNQGLQPSHRPCQDTRIQSASPGCVCQACNSLHRRLHEGVAAPELLPGSFMLPLTPRPLKSAVAAFLGSPVGDAARHVC